MQLSKTQTKEVVIFSRVGAVNKPGVAPERSPARPGTIESSSLIKITLRTDCVNYIPGSNEAIRGAGGGVGVGLLSTPLLCKLPQRIQSVAAASSGGSAVPPLPLSEC